MKVDFLADTNFLIYLHEGNEIVKPFIDLDFGVSFISEVELLGFHGLSKSDEQKLKNLIHDCFLFDWSLDIKNKTIELKKNIP